MLILPGFFLIITFTCSSAQGQVAIHTSPQTSQSTILDSSNDPSALISSIFYGTNTIKKYEIKSTTVTNQLSVDPMQPPTQNFPTQNPSFRPQQTVIDKDSISNSVPSFNDVQHPVQRPQFTNVQHPVQKPINSNDFLPEQQDINNISNMWNDDFDWKLIRHVLQTSPKNVIISPFSVKFALSLLAEGAVANTTSQNEIFTALGIDQKSINNDLLLNIQKMWKSTLDSLTEKSDAYDLSFASGIFIDEKVKNINQKTQSKLEMFYHTLIKSVSFKNSRNTSNLINEWSSNSTRGHIKNIITEEQIKNSVMLLLNAIYFKGKWKNAFDPNESYFADFYAAAEYRVNVQYVTKRYFYNFMDSHSLNAKILQIPYEGNRFHLTLLLPKAKEGLQELIHNLSPEMYKKLEWAADEETEVKLTMPKLSFEFETSLKDVLQNLGVKEIFSDDAKLTGFGQVADSRLKVSDIYQKSGLQIDESGSTAYSETVSVIENKFGGEIEDFNANRPFIFFIQDKKEKKILFAGKIVNPLQN